MHGSSERAADVSCGCRRGLTIEVMDETKNMRKIGAASISPHMIMQLGSTHQEHKLVLYSADGSKITDQSDLQTTVEEDDGLMLLSQVRSVHPVNLDSHRVPTEFCQRSRCLAAGLKERRASGLMRKVVPGARVGGRAARR